MGDKKSVNYNENTGFFELNGLTDITYNEMISIYNWSIGVRKVNGDNTKSRYVWDWGDKQPRTILPLSVKWGASLQYAFSGNYLLTVLNIRMVDSASISDLQATFNNCQRLQEVQGIIVLQQYYYGYSISDNTFSNCIALKEIRIKRAYKSMNLKWSPNLSLESFLYMVENSSTIEASANMTLTVHPDVYSKLTDPDNTEWYALNELAISKNITFATA